MVQSLIPWAAAAADSPSHVTGERRVTVVRRNYPQPLPSEKLSSDESTFYVGKGVKNPSPPAKARESRKWVLQDEEWVTVMMPDKPAYTGSSISRTWPQEWPRPQYLNLAPKQWGEPNEGPHSQQTGRFMWRNMVLQISQSQVMFLTYKGHRHQFLLSQKQMGGGAVKELRCFMHIVANINTWVLCSGPVDVSQYPSDAAAHI